MRGSASRTWSPVGELTGELCDATADDSTRVTLHAHAKLTRSLRMTGVRDDGFHLIDAEMVSIGLHDLITITPNGTGVEVTGPFSDGVPIDGSNLVARALELAGRRAHVAIDKRIPHGGGLGGGSTDAAAVLHWAGFGTDPEALVAASRLGADISFCLVGGRARVHRHRRDRRAPPPHRASDHTRDPATVGVHTRRLPSLGRAGRPDR